MDIFEIRRRNLLALLASMKERGTRLQKDQAQRLGIAPSFLSQLAAGKKMGEEVARKLEDEARKSHGWMDQPHWVGSAEEMAPEGQSHSLGLDADTLSETAKALLERDPNKDWFKVIIDRPDLFIQAYRLYSERTSDVITERQLGIKLADLLPLHPRDATGDEREKKMPASGTPRRSVGKSGKR